VDEANLAVHISALRKLLSASGERSVEIETIPKVGYRLFVHAREERSEGNLKSGGENEKGEPRHPAATETNDARPGVGFKYLMIFVGSLAGVAMVVIVFALYWTSQGGFAMGEGTNATNRKSAFTWNRLECPRDSVITNREVGGCEDAVKAFSLEANPNGNWAFGYALKDDPASFNLFEKGNHNNHFGSPEVPADWWSRANDWHPLILKNTSNVVFLIQGAVVVPPTMFEMHPGPEGERSVVRWTAPADGLFRFQGQFRGINGSGYTSTDALVIENGSIVRYSESIEGYNFEKPFDLTFKLTTGQTVDFSVGYGMNGKYEGDSTGFSVIATTLSLENGAVSSVR
jgi:hypothetical protein